MSILFWGLTVGTIGKVLLALGVILAHWELAKERTIDEAVVRYFRHEYFITIFGIFLIILGYLLELYFYGQTDLLLLD